MAYVLVVDDEAAIRGLLTRWLSSWGYAAKEAANADAAIEIMAVEPAEIMLCDVMMPVHDGVWLADLGRHRLRDLSRHERVAQLCHPDLAVEFPPLRSLDTFPHNLPVQLTSFVGRGAEVSEVRRLVLDNRLVSLTGAGGAGKSRLAHKKALVMAISV